MGVQRRYVPHLKGLISGKVELKGQGRGSTITLCHAQLKKAILHLKTAIVRIFICPSVYGQSLRVLYSGSNREAFAKNIIQSCSEQTGHLLFFIQNAHSCEGRKLPKRHAKFTNFSSIACINVGSFSISFGSKISSGSGDSSCQKF